MDNSQGKILIVEDELIIAKSLARQLEKFMYEVVGIVSTGEKALAKIESDPPDLVLMDIVIAGEMDGIETAQKIQERFQIPVIYLTAYSDEETLKRVQESGSYGYILKPYKQREVHAAIMMALSRDQTFIHPEETE
ncbi:response regulator receiver protein [Halothece sp. PCC 7418]|uniref:response regulator n=1 Tax=Halothece sp. (strain PCC 7418) TaxID=65093 RepID=UPI0002A08113|nr:response regulator [Halothece sp. PCC 7418]AFZ43781.1 response regulator receiver protein [Halothece sp. PCC 7418]